VIAPERGICPCREAFCLGTAPLGIGIGLLIAFTFSGAAARFDARRHLVVEEADAISTAYLRLDVLPSDAQAQLRDKFRRYVETRRAVYRKQDMPRSQRLSERNARRTV
jgi:hypothetical protein